MGKPSYPLMLTLTGRLCVVIGGGTVAVRKIKSLLASGADRITVVSPEAASEIIHWSKQRQIVWKQKVFSPDDIERAVLVFAATNHPEVNRSVYEALAPGQWINIADRPDLSTFTVPSHFRSGQLTISVSTGGASPGLARKISGELKEQYGEVYGNYIDFLARSRSTVLATVAEESQRRAIFKRLLDNDFFTCIKEQDDKRLGELFNQLIIEVTGKESDQ
ncbi:precorrin-2 dehydrogenase/sirohydrochlorin ferrochelatase family protein [Aneurinibacillus terranovensis]|uniref:precorrin-2 dehydrogenase/sirohydrochlorin ferrochelatase family protein n=1 Tax=Aneurinibacillus terranovensis TaxID=278991 RepID=UPI00041BC544|nr:NAD(P)-dependent oxidoreductase [Aneurinibacillus terranovensis]